MELITKLSGLLKAITYTIRVICRVNFKTVSVAKSCLGITLSHYKAGLSGMLFCSFGLRVGFERAANVHDRLDRIFVNTYVLSAGDSYSILYILFT